MPTYGKIKVNTLTYDASGTATDVPISTIATDTDLALKANLAGPTFTGTINGASLILSGDLTVNGSTTTIDTTTLQVEDKNIQIGKVSTPSNATADGGGITLLGGSDGDKTINWVNSTDAWTFSENINIAAGKKLGVGGSNYGTSGQVLTSGGASAAPSWAAVPAGGNAVELVADGAIGAGKPVIITAAGKVKAISLETQAITNPSLRDHTSVADNTEGLWGAAIWHSTTSRGLLAYRKYGGSNDMRLAQFSMNANAQSISCGASRQIYGNVTMWNKIIMDPDIDKPIVFWQTDHSGDKYVYSRSVTMNGNGSSGDGDPQASTQGSSQPRSSQQYSDGDWDVCYDTNANIFVFVYRDDSDAGRIKVRLGYQSEPASGQHKITWINTDVTIDGDGEYPRCVFDTVNNKVIFAWGSGGGHDIGAAIGTVSGTGSSATISCGNVVTVSGDGPRKPKMAWHTDSGQAGFLYQDTSNNYNKIITLKTSGTTVHYTASTRVGTENVDDMACWYSSGTKTLRTGTKGRFNWISSMGSATSGGSGATAPTVGSGIVTLTDIGGSINDWEPNYGFDLPDHSLYTGLFSTRGDDSNRMKMITMTIGSQVSNATSENVIGFTESAINDTATGTILLDGNVSTNQSGLTPASRYYVQNDGTLGTTSASTNFGGIALAADKLLITHQRSGIN